MTRPAADDRIGSPGGVSPAAYERLLDAAETYREVLVIRLCGDVGLRPAEIARLTPECVRRIRDDPPRFLLAVPETGEAAGHESGADPVTGDGPRDGTVADDDAAERHAYLPTTVERELRRYVRSNDIDGADRIFSVTPRRLQMLVSAVADRASERADVASLGSLSTGDLRRYFAHTALVEHDVNPRVVKAVGGWQTFAALESYLTSPGEDEIVAAFDAVEDRSSTPSPDSGGSDVGDRSDRVGRDPVADRHQAVTAAVLEATTHEHVETETCAALVAGDPYDLAWIDRTIPADRPQNWRTVSGVEPAVADRLAAVVDERGDDGSAVSSSSPGATAATAVSVVRDLAVEHGDDQFDGDVATVPITHGDTVYGSLRTGTARPEAFDDTELTALETLGRLAGYAIAAIRRRNLLLADSLLELEFVCRDERSFLVDVSARLECRFELTSLVRRSESTHLFYVRLAGAPPADVFDLAAERDGVEDCRLLETGADSWRVEFVVTGSAPALSLTEYGTSVRDVVVDDGVSTITAECAVDADVRTIVEGLRSTFPDAELGGKRTVERSAQTAGEYRRDIEDRLTDRQEATLRAAYFGGYYDWPRESTAEEIADAMGISSPTLHNHLRKGQHELLRTFFDEESDHS